MKKLRQWYKDMVYKVRSWLRYRKKMKELQKRDPYIYK